MLDGEVSTRARGGFGAGEEEGLAKVGSVGGGYVGAAVADHNGAREVEGVVAGGAEQHAGGGLAVFVVALEFADAVLGVVRAVVDGVEGGSFAGELGAHPGHEVLELLRGVEAAGDAGLVGDDDQAVAEGLGGAAKGEDAVDEADLGREMEVAYFVVDYAVAVEEKGWAWEHFGAPEKNGQQTAGIRRRKTG